MRIKSKEQYIFEYKGLEDVRNNAAEYARVFVDYGLLCFRNAHLNDPSATDVLEELCSRFSWTPLSADANRSRTWKYTQNYDGRLATDSEFTPDKNLNSKMINRWHTEGVYSKNPQYAAGWNMRHFKCDSGVGQTGFADASELLKQMPIHLVEFLRRAELIHYPPIINGRPPSVKEFTDKFTESVNELSREIWCEDGERIIPSYPHLAIDKHPDRDVDVLRLCPCTEEWGSNHVLFSVDGKSPTDKDIALFGECISWLDSALEVESNQWWHEWVEGDFVIPDLFVMIHSAKAGFGIGEREFDGFWCFEKGTDSPPDGMIKVR
jgi:alpha-ketoglutarate-dependent taurine dioxygenase